MIDRFERCGRELTEDLPPRHHQAHGQAAGTWAVGRLLVCIIAQDKAVALIELNATPGLRRVRRFHLKHYGERCRAFQPFDNVAAITMPPQAGSYGEMFDIAI